MRNVVMLAVGLGPSPGSASAETLRRLPLLQQTARDAVTITRSSYNYAPAVIHDGGLYHLYWCGGVAGDTILHLKAPALTGPWTASSFWSRYDIALSPTTSKADFDGLHTCDPNVLKRGDTFYLYYTGEAADGALSAIGVASSRDGIHFTRLNNGRPIVTAAETNPGYAAAHLTYGAGQPAAVYIKPYVYLSFSDSTGAGVNKGNGAGQFALRSTDPAFGRDIEELTAAGWVKRSPGAHTAAYAYLESFGLDLTYDPMTNLLIAASDRVAGQVWLYALSPDTLRTVASGTLALDWKEGPAIVAEADKTTVPRRRCDAALDITIFAAAGASGDPFSWHAIHASSGRFSLAAFCP